MNTIAIVGRPNVGKSTLFNRIIGRDEAIYAEEPGVTRDRIYGQADWAGRHFTIIDTGGIVPDSEDLFDAAIREQAQLAIDEAQSIIFVCDGRTGVTAIDQEIACMLLRSGKHITLAINKLDDPKHDAYAYEFASLGLGEPFGFSALSGRSIGEMLDHAVLPLSAHEQELHDTRLKIALVGRPNVGKSSLCNALLGKERTIVTPIAGTTRDAIDSVLRYHGEEMILIDTAGLRRKSRIKEHIELFSIVRTQRAIERCDVAVVVIDALQGFDTQDKRIINDVVEARKGIIVAVNKWDAVEKDHTTADILTKQMYAEMKTVEYAPIVFLSAHSKQRISKIPNLAREIQARRMTRIPTWRLNQELLEDIARTPPPSVQGHDLRINYITQAGVTPPLFVFFSNFPELIPESYKRFLERKLREHYDLKGVPVSFLFRRKNTLRSYE
ncbi:MAG: ribosome biogenesis GTPase Der [Bacteroidota bacterium]|nr:ribosome biogenesis GTPase Der [Candidatus Kapabacteria bacterium]MDW8220243.1 ribosome biogenesis GTPase Der [Bacteroidota bacterium]